MGKEAVRRREEDERVVHNNHCETNHAVRAHLCRRAPACLSEVCAGERQGDSAVARYDGEPEHGEGHDACAGMGVHRAHTEEHEKEVARRRGGECPCDRSDEHRAVPDFCGCRANTAWSVGCLGVL